uniref:Cytochrome c oxidase subunit 7A1, mitochondrial n=1 Tax=Oreochromis niloticus TaxID=8128 RepID=A0A669B2A9_ORENI
YSHLDFIKDKIRGKLPLLASRAFSSSARQLKNKVPESQKIFQADNGLPVHIKGGTGDVLLYRATMTLTIAGEERCSSFQPHIAFCI